MSAKKMLPILLLFLGESLIIVFFILFCNSKQQDITILEIVVSSIIYFLFFINLLTPWIDFSDVSQKKVGAIGFYWFVTFIYSILTIGGLIYFNSYDFRPFSTQLFYYCVLVLFLLIGLFLSFSSSDKVSEIYFDEKIRRDQIMNLNKAIQDLKRSLVNMNSIPQSFLTRIDELQENIRFLSPCNNDTATDLEISLLNQINNLKDNLLNSTFDLEKNNSILNIAENTYRERKKIYSN
jgi:hypothetical protein